jgi:hypothetical protein
MSSGVSMAFAVDVLVAILLVATIVYAVVLNRKLTALRRAKAEMDATVVRFAESTGKATSGIAALKAHAQESGAALESTLTRAHSLADDLTFLIERGSNLANRLEKITEVVRGKEAFNGPARAARPVAPAAAASPEETALRKALQGIR